MIGNAKVRRVITSSQEELDNFMTNASLSDTWLLNTVSYKALGDGIFECEMVRITMFSYVVTPVITVCIERQIERALLIKVLDVRISIQDRHQKQWDLKGATVDSSNVVSWKCLGDDEQELQSHLRISVGVHLPWHFPLPRKAIEKPASLILERTCQRQCRQLLEEIEQGFQAKNITP